MNLFLMKSFILSFAFVIGILQGSLTEKTLKIWNIKSDIKYSFSNVERSKWQNITTIKDILEYHPNKLTRIFESLDYSHQGLEEVKKALNSADTIAAGQALIKYFKNRSQPDWLLENTENFVNAEEKKQAKEILKDFFTRREVTAEIPKMKNGGWQWNFTGPEKDDEFGYTLNRHRYFLLLLKGWKETGEKVYAKKFDTIIRDWAIQNPLPEKSDSVWVVHRTTTQELDWRDIGEVIWRDLEAGVRLGETWLPAFFGFQQAESFTPAGRLLMLHSILIQADYLRNYHKSDHNWTTMEMNGLGLVGLLFPEFKKANEWADYAIKTMEKEINGQVYPDGTQTEISTLTQQVALERFESLADNFQKAGRDVPESYLNRIEYMYNYLAYGMRPDGYQPLNNDSDRDDLRPKVLKAAEQFNRPDWEYIATKGEMGKKPKGYASKVFPWAGLHFMRNGWDADSHWSVFDAGPFGTGHQHADMLHLSVHAYGRDLLVDSGRFTHENYFSFDPTNWRGYFRSSFSQNVILVDGKGQGAGPLRAEKPLEEGIDFVNTKSFDYAIGTFSYGYANGTNSGFSQDNVIQAEHTRAVFYLKDNYWVIVDQVKTGRTRKIETLWNHAPDVNVEIEGNQIVSNDKNKGNVRIVPIGDVPWSVEIIKGQTEPFIRGWYSETYGKKEEIRTAVYSSDIDGEVTFAWIIVPAFGPVPKVTEAKLIKINEKVAGVEVNIEDKDSQRIIIPLSKNNSPKLQN